MDFIVSNLEENMGKVISTFNVGGVQENINMSQDEFLFTDGFNENIKSNNVEEIQMLKDEVINKKEEKKKTRVNKKKNVKLENDKEKTINNKRDVKAVSEDILSNKENVDNEISKNFKDYIKLCNSMGLIPYWAGFDKYNKL